MYNAHHGPADHGGQPEQRPRGGAVRVQVGPRGAELRRRVVQGGVGRVDSDAEGVAHLAPGAVGEEQADNLGYKVRYMLYDTLLLV